jgi:DNA-binding PadR family transcriptional regulator
MYLVKQMKIGQKEQQLFLDIHDLIFVDMAYLLNNVYIKDDGTSYHEVYVRNILRDLEKQEYIKIYNIVNDEHVRSYKRVFTLDRNGVEEVKALLGDSHWDNRWTERTPTYIYHALRGAHIKASFEAKKEENVAELLDYNSFVSERNSFFQYGKGKMDVIRPDGTLIFSTREADISKVVYVPYFIEVERSRQMRSVSCNKLKRFDAYAKEKAYKEHERLERDISGNVRVLFISEAEGEMNNLIKHTEGVPTTNLNAVLYTTYEQVITNPYGAIWRVKGKPDSLVCLTDKIK